MKLFLTIFILCRVSALSQKNPHQWETRNTIVHLFEWKFRDIAAECEDFLGPKGYGGVQTSPVHENIIVPNRPWWERYQPISYKIITRSGNEDDFKNMVTRCNKVGVRIYVDVIFNHMTKGGSDNITGTGGSTANPNLKQYPAVPYGPNDFNSDCSVEDYNNPVQQRNCQLLGLYDLNIGKEYVRNKILEALNHLMDLGVAGFRIDAAKHIWPSDLKSIYDRLRNLNVWRGFAPNTRPFIYQEVIDLGGEKISRDEYTPLGVVTEFRHSFEIGRVFSGHDQLKYLRNWGTGWSFLNSNDALVFVDNHDNQRGRGIHEANILTYKQSKQYKMAVAFMLAHPYGIPRIMSSYHFTDAEMGPPQDTNENIISPNFTPEGTCTNGWICEHRWRQIFNMIEFKNVVTNTTIENWWDNNGQQIAFGRADKGFIVFNNQDNLRQTLQTGLPPGIYCDVISGSSTSNGCSGKTIIVKCDGTAFIELNDNEEDGVLAIHINAQQYLNLKCK